MQEKKLTMEYHLGWSKCRVYKTGGNYVYVTIICLEKKKKKTLAI